MIGGLVSHTLIVKVQELALLFASNAVAVIVVVPIGNGEPLIGLLNVILTPTASVAVTAG